MVTSSDGGIWVADTGGATPRAEVSVLRWGGSGPDSRQFDLVYPDGPHDAEALLVSLTGVITVVTKATDGQSGVYAAQLPLSDKAILTKAGELDVAGLRIGNDTSPASLPVTGGAVSPDGNHAALRTPTTAYEWYSPDGDIVSALLTSRPHVVGLTTQTDGKAVTYTNDGTKLLAVSTGLPATVESIPISRDSERNVSSGAVRLPPRVIIGLAGVTALLVVLALVAWRLRRRAAAVTTYQVGEE
jgi:hypothetical protein